MCRGLLGREMRKVEKDMLAAETTLEGRRVIALKAEGPGGNVGKPGDAIRQVLEENNGKASMIIMIDAGAQTGRRENRRGQRRNRSRDSVE